MEGEDLGGVEEPLGVEGGFEGALLVELLGGELDGHEVALLDANAVFAGEAATDLDAELQDVGAEVFGAVEAVGVVGVEHDQRVEVAVAGVEDVGDTEGVLGAELGDAFEDEGELRRWDGAVHAEVVGADAADGAEGSLAAFPDGQGLFRRFGDLQADGVEAFADGLDAVEKIILFGGAAFDLDDQHGFGIQRVAGVGEGLAGVDAGFVHEFEGDRNDAGGDDGVDGRTRDFGAVEGGEHGAGAFGAAEDADGDLGDQAELAFGAGDEAEPVVAGGVEVGAADGDDLTLDGDEFQAEEVVGGDAVFQAVGAAGIHHHVAADHAGELG